MSGFKSYSTDPNANTAMFAEFQSASSVNDGARQLQADAAAHYFDHDWIEYGKGNGAGDGTTADYTSSYVSATQARILSADVTAAYHVGRRVRATGSLTGTIYGTITATTYSGTYTEVTVAWDSGNLENETLRFYLGPSAVNTSWPKAALEGKSLNLNNVLQKAQAMDTRDAFVTANPVSNVGGRPVQVHAEPERDHRHGDELARHRARPVGAVDHPAGRHGQPHAGVPRRVEVAQRHRAEHHHHRQRARPLRAVQ